LLFATKSKWIPAFAGMTEGSLLFQKNRSMALISLKQLPGHAAGYPYGLPAFNVNNMEQIRPIALERLVAEYAKAA
jgi:hypothetical protein